MSERTIEFDIEGTPILSLRLPAGNTRIVAGEPGRVVIRLVGSERDLSRYVVERRGDTIVVEPERTGSFGRWSSVDLVVEAGEAPEIGLRSGSGGLTATTPLASLTVDTATGDMNVPEVLGSLTMKSASGDLRAGVVGEWLEFTGASGDVRVDRAGHVRVRLAAGDLSAREVLGSVTVKSASGDVSVGTFRGDSFDVKTLSGDVLVGLTAGRHFDVSFQTLSGDVRTEFPVSGGEDVGGAPARLSITSMSGDIRVRSATG
jgi:DUF4097 and DUF4098 domain-containing protein YvlB